MFTPLPKVSEPNFPVVRIERNLQNNGWQVFGAHPRTFFDEDNQSSINNCYVAAVTYSEMMVRNSKRAYSTNRNFVLIEKKDRYKQMQLHVRITRPMGGYKFCLVTPTGPAENPVQYDDIRRAVVEAVSWFFDEREKCQDAITSKNIETKSKRKSERHSLLFGGFIPKTR